MARLVVGCLRAVSDCFNGGGGGGGAWRAGDALNPAPDTPDVTLDSRNMGQEAVLVKNGSRLCGTGAARSTAPICQNKAYWEVKVQQSGKWSCGVANDQCGMSDPLGVGPHSWAITSDRSILHRDHAEYTLQDEIQEGDVIGFTYDHVELNFYVNGVNLNCPILGIKGTVYPILYVDDGAILDSIFESFRNTTPPGFDRILLEKALL